MRKTEYLDLFLSHRSYIHCENSLSSFPKVDKWVLDATLSLILFKISEQKNTEFKPLWSVSI